MLPNEEKSVWRDDSPGSIYPSLNQELNVDVAIVGAGISGLTTAYLLKKAGLNVAVLEKDTVGGGTTGRTTGKVTSQHNLIYADFADRLGEAVARTYGEANQSAVGQVAKIIKDEGIDCDWAQDDNYVYTADVAQVKQFKHEAEVAARLGLPASFEKTSPLPFNISAAVKFTNQGKLNTQKYLLGLAKTVNGNGSYIFEHSQVNGINESRVKTRHGKVFAKHIVVATNVPTLPLMARGAYCALEYPRESFIVAGRLAKKFSGMYISPDKGHYSILPINISGEPFLLVGGESRLPVNKTKQRTRYEKLANYAEEHFGVNTFTHRWSDRDYSTYDGPPLIGQIYSWSKHRYVASAYGKWGLTNGTVAGTVLSDLILERPNPWADVFKPTRLKPVLNIPRVFFRTVAKK